MSAHFEQAKVHIDRNEIDQAIISLCDHLNGDFQDADALMLLGCCMIEKGKNGAGAALLMRSLDIRKMLGKPFPEALINLGAAFKGEQKIPEAEEIWNLALEVETIPHERAKILSNLGGCHINEGNAAKAVWYLDKAVATRPEFMGARFNRGLAHLELGHWAQGWKDFECGFADGTRRQRRYGTIPVWDGSPGKTVIVYGDQGVGDEIMFSSCLPDMLKRCKRVIFDCHHRLQATFKRSFPMVEVQGTRKVQSQLEWVEGCDADAAVCLSSLPLYFRNKDKDFPGTPFLTAGDSFKRPAKVPYVQSKPRIGIAWAGGTKKTRMDLRSIPLEQWLPVLKAVDADWYSLQYTTDAAREVCELEETSGVRIRHWPGWVQCVDYDKTIAFIASLDLVLTVCTTAHHAANAVGIPTWTLVPSKPAWRYGAKGHLWYRETSQFFRQAMGEDWAPTIARVATALKARFA